MRNRISIYQRAITPPVFGSTNLTEKYNLIANVWASVRTKQGDEIFSGVDTGGKMSYIFTIRYREQTPDNKYPLGFPVPFSEPISGTDAQSTYIVQWDSNNYKIFSVEDPDKRKRFLVVRCILLGDENLEVNQ